MVVWFSLNGRYRAYYWTGAEGRVARNSLVILVKEENIKAELLEEAELPENINTELLEGAELLENI